ncbi:MAG: hypothetical protein AAF703_08540 [Cyanobacteria bacterium P01_D01_bin.105]
MKKRGALKYNLTVRNCAIGVAVAIFFIFCFTSRLIPPPEKDRAVFISVAEHLRSGSQLYVDIYDNKDPLFFYAVLLQRLLGPLGEYLFELAMVIVAAVSAYVISQRVEQTTTKRKLWLLVAVPLLVTGQFWLPGLSHLSATAFSLLACALFLRGNMPLAGGCMGIIAFSKVIMFPLPIVFCLAYEMILWDGKKSLERLKSMLAGFVSVSILVVLMLLVRDEWLGYVSAQQNNFLYVNNGLLLDSSSFGSAFASRLRTIFLNSLRKVPLLFSLIVSMGFAGRVVIQSRKTHAGIGKKNKAFLLSTLATYVVSMLILGMTGIWDQHLQLLYFSQTLMLIFIVIHLRFRGVFAKALFGITVIVASILLSGGLNVLYFVDSPRNVVEKLSLYSQASAETKALRAIYPDGTGFARLGQNTHVIPYGAIDDELLCPEFQQYYFYDPERLKRILDCAQTSPTLVIDRSFSHYEKAPLWWPKESQKQAMIENWNNFVALGENIIEAQYACEKIGDVRICESVKK